MGQYPFTNVTDNTYYSTKRLTVKLGLQKLFKPRCDYLGQVNFARGQAKKEVQLPGEQVKLAF